MRLSPSGLGRRGRLQSRTPRASRAKRSTLISLESILPALGAFGGTFVYASFFEWTLHRFLMHRSYLLRYPFQTHALTHHRLFRHDESYHLARPEDIPKVRFAVWNAPLLIGLHVPLLWLVGRWTGWPMLVPGVLAMTLYYTLYETLHWCMHVPKDRWIEKTSAFRWLTAHHRAHHQLHDSNLNVVLPVADFVFRTLRPWKPPARPATAPSAPAPPVSAVEVGPR